MLYYTARQSLVTPTSIVLMPHHIEPARYTEANMQEYAGILGLIH
jgi:hypothetical protein